MTADARDIQKHVLPNGLVVLTETMPHVRSVSVGIWIRTGSRREHAAQNGIAHFLEHMVFKGTERRSAEEIARSMDSVGGMLDAFTAKELTCFNAKVLDEHLPIAFDVISDLILRPRFDAGDVEKERQVVLEEIKMDQDNPESLLHEIFTEGFWPDHALGRPIHGTPETVRRFTRETLFEHHRAWFAPDRLVLTAAGNVHHEQVLELAQREFAGLAPAGPASNAVTPRTSAPILGTPETVRRFARETLFEHHRAWFAPDRLVLTAAGNVHHEQVLELAQREFAGLAPAGPASNAVTPRTSAPILLESKRDLEQVHLCLGVPSFPLAHERRFAVAVLNNLLGGGMSSRLFQNIREKQGLAYAVFSELTPYSDTGMLSVYAGTALEAAGKVVDLVMREFRNLKESPVTEEELRRAKDHLKGSLMLSLESTSARMSNLARQELYFERFYTLDEILDSIEAVTRKEVQQIAREFFQTDLVAATVLGPLNGFSLDRAHLAC